jgi:hypothetical protein
MKKGLAISVVGFAATTWLVFLLGCAGHFHLTTPAARGEAEAQEDVAQGKFKLLRYGLPAPWAEEYFRILNQRYGIQSVPVAGCVVTDDLVTHANAYNKMSMDAAKRKFGEDIFKRAERDATRNWQMQRASHGAP